MGSMIIPLVVSFALVMIFGKWIFFDGAHWGFFEDRPESHYD